MKTRLEAIKKRRLLVLTGNGGDTPDGSTIDFILAELDRIEKQTAEKALDIAEVLLNTRKPHLIPSTIRHHFDLKETLWNAKPANIK